MDKTIIEIMPESSLKEDEEKALLQKLLIDELMGIKDSGIVNNIIDDVFQELANSTKSEGENSLGE